MCSHPAAAVWMLCSCLSAPDGSTPSWWALIPHAVAQACNLQDVLHPGLSVLSRKIDTRCRTPGGDGQPHVTAGGAFQRACVCSVCGRWGPSVLSAKCTSDNSALHTSTHPAPERCGRALGCEGQSRACLRVGVRGVCLRAGSQRAYGHLQAPQCHSHVHHHHHYQQQQQQQQQTRTSRPGAGSIAM